MKISEGKNIKASQTEQLHSYWDIFTVNFIVVFVSKGKFQERKNSGTQPECIYYLMSRMEKSFLCFLLHKIHKGRNFVFSFILYSYQHSVSS